MPENQSDIGIFRLFIYFIAIIFISVPLMILAVGSGLIHFFRLIINSIYQNMDTAFIDYTCGKCGHIWSGSEFISLCPKCGNQVEAKNYIQ